MSDSFDNSNLYECLFLISQSAIGSGLNSVIDHIRENFARVDAEVITLRRWDDRKLAYPIKGQKRGVFVFSLFRVDGTRLHEFERSCNLSEQILRIMVTRCEHYGQVELDAELEQAKNSEVDLKLREQHDQPVEDADETEDEAIESVAD